MKFILDINLPVVNLQSLQMEIQLIILETIEIVRLTALERQTVSSFKD